MEPNKLQMQHQAAALLKEAEELEATFNYDAAIERYTNLVDRFSWLRDGFDFLRENWLAETHATDKEYYAKFAAECHSKAEALGQQQILYPASTQSVARSWRSSRPSRSSRRTPATFLPPTLCTYPPAEQRKL